MANQHWAVLTIGYVLTATGYIIIAVTNVECHLFTRWSTQQPWIHHIPVLQRGIFMHTDIRLCFTVFEDNEQEEPGDTLVHTFLKPDWPSCTTRYFYFHGTIDGNPTPSTTAIFKKHRTAPTEPTEFEKHDSPLAKKVFVNNPGQEAQTFTPQLNYEMTKLDLPFMRMSDTTVGTLHIQLRTTVGSYPSDEVLWETTMDVADLPLDPNWVWVTFNLPNIPLTAETLYAIVTYLTDYEYWWKNHLLAADDTYEYPRGEYCYRTTPTGSWRASARIDHGFITWGF